MPESKQGKSLPNLYRKRRELLKKLHSIGPAARGSIIQYSRFCGKKSCRRCQRGEGHSSLFLSVSTEGKTYMVSLSTSSKEKTAKEWSSGYKKLQKAVEEITRINLELLSANNFPRARNPNGLPAPKEKLYLEDLTPFSLKEISRKLSSINTQVNLEHQEVFHKERFRLLSGY